MTTSPFPDANVPPRVDFGIVLAEDPDAPGESAFAVLCDEDNRCPDSHARLCYNPEHVEDLLIDFLYLFLGNDGEDLVRSQAFGNAFHEFADTWSIDDAGDADATGAP